MVRIEHKRSLLVFHFGDKKFEWPIETRHWRNPVLGIGCLALLPLIFIGRLDFLNIIATANIYACIAIPLAWQMTGIGRMNFGPQVFVGIGGFAAALLSVHLGWGPWATLPMVILVGFVFCVPLSLLTNIAHGLYFSIITLVLPLIFLEMTYSFVNIFQGEAGIYGIAPLFNIANIKAQYLVSGYLGLIIMVIYLFAVVKIYDSRVGLYASAINDDEEVANTLGLNIKKWKIICFVVTSMMMSIAGWYAAHYFGTFAGSTYLPLNFMLKILLIVMIGGRGSIYGVLYGAYFIVILEKVLMVFGSVHYILFPVILLILLFTLKEGLFGVYRKHRYREYYPTIRVRRR